MRGFYTLALVRLALMLALGLFASRPAVAQAARKGRLVVTVVDQSNAVIPNATVTAGGLEDATRKTIPDPVQTTADGIAMVPRLLPGRYNVQAEFPGFEPGVLKDVRVRAGDNKHVIVLPIQKVQEAVTVGQDKQEGAADRRGSAFGTTLTTASRGEASRRRRRSRRFTSRGINSPPRTMAPMGHSSTSSRSQASGRFGRT